MDIGPGDWVECISGPPLLNGCTNVAVPLTIGQIYRVRSVFMGDGARGDNIPLLYVHGVSNRQSSSGVEQGYDVIAFRPIYRPDPLLIEALKAEPIEAEWVQMARIIGRTDGFIASQPHSPALRRILRGLS